jgi:hypothetical protein
MTEQRKNQRFDLRLPFELIRGGATTKVSGETRNVSSCGVLFTADQPVPLGEAVEYLITFPKAPGTRAAVRLRCMGKVLREDATSAYAATLERYEFVREPV